VAAGPVDHGRRLAHGLGQGRRRAGADGLVALGQTLWRAPRAVALASLPTFAFLLSLWFLFESRQPRALEIEIILLCVRAILAAIFAVVHLSQVRRALNQLAEEGQIKL
jgi:hypothetical protein